MAYKVNASRAGDGTGNYNLSYGKGAKKLTAVMARQESSGLFKIEGVGLGVKGDIIDKWRVWAEATYAGEEAPPESGVPDEAPGDVVTGACPSMATGEVATPIQPLPKPPGPPPLAKRGPPVLPPRKGPPVMPPKGPPSLPPRSGPPVKPPAAPATVPSPAPMAATAAKTDDGPVLARFGTAAELAKWVTKFNVSVKDGHLILVLGGEPFKLDPERAKRFAFDVADHMKG